MPTPKYLNVSKATWPTPEDWPLSIENGQLRATLLQGQGLDWPLVEVVFVAPDGRIFPLNGIAKREANYQDLNEIWLENPVIPSTKKSISDLIDLGRSLHPQTDRRRR